MTALRDMSDMEVFVAADCRRDGLEDPSDCACAPAYACHFYRREVTKRGIDLARMRKVVALAKERLRTLSHHELVMISVEDNEGLWRLAWRVIRERDR